MKTTPRSWLTKSLVLAGAILSATQVFAYAANTWKADSSGSWNGKYSDVNHWSRGHLPDLNANGGGNSGEDAVFP